MSQPPIIYSPPRSPPAPVDYARYSHELPSSGDRPPSREEQDNYFDHEPPAPYRLSGSYISPGHSPSGSVDHLPTHSRTTSEGYGPGGINMQTRGTGTGPRYLSPLAAASATETEGIGMRNSNYSQMSMVGLNQTSGLQRRSTWLEKEQGHTKKNRRLFVIGCSTLTLLLVAGVVLGIVFGTRSAKNSSSSGSSNQGNETVNTSVAGVVQQDGNDPSQFVKNATFKQSFYGVAYTMMDALYPDCNEGLPNVIEDMQILSQLTTRIRLYGSDCNQTQLVLEAIKQTKVNITIYPAIYIVVDDDSAYQRQKGELKDAITTYGVDHIEGITVGNEYMLDYVTAHGDGTGVTGAAGTTASTFLKTKIADTRQMMKDLGYPNVPVGSADAGAYFNQDLMGAIDFGLSNIHAWFAPTTAAGAAAWTNEFYQDTNVAAAQQVSNHPKMVIAETGWPTHSNGTATETSGAGPGSDASVANLQVFLDTFICQANTNATPYFMFEYTDVPWKDRIYGGVEGFWGMFDSHKNLKQITLPDCPHQ